MRPPGPEKALDVSELMDAENLASLTAERSISFEEARKRRKRPWATPKRVIPFGFGHGEKMIDFFPHPLHEVIDPLFLAVGRPLKELYPVRGVFYLLVPAEGPRVVGDFLSFTMIST